MPSEPTNQEILEALHEGLHMLASHMDDRFMKLESAMATKDFVDRRISDVETQLIPVVKTVDAKDSALVETLKIKARLLPKKLQVSYC